MALSLVVVFCRKLYPKTITKLLYINTIIYLVSATRHSLLDTEDWHPFMLSTKSNVCFNALNLLFVSPSHFSYSGTESIGSPV